MQHRRIRISASASLGPPALVAIGLGLAVGFVVGELFGGGRPSKAIRRTVGRLRTPAIPQGRASDLVEDLRATMAGALGPDANTIELAPAGRHAIELRGWVSNRGSRTRAIRLVRESLPAGMTLVDRLLIWGEDDRPLPDPAPSREPELG